MRKVIAMRGLIGLLGLLSVGAPAVRPATQEAAQTFTLPDSSGRKVSLNQFKGRVVLIDFWATWCGPCRQSMPHLQKLHKNYAEDGLVVIGINVEGPDPKVLRYIQDGGYTFTMLFDRNSQVRRSYRARGIPFSVLIDRGGLIQYAGHPLGLDERLLREVLKTGVRDRKTGLIITTDAGAAKAGPADRPTRAARRFYEEGMDQKRMGNFGRAAEFFLAALEAQPTYLEAHKEYIEVMRFMGKGAALLNNYREWIAEDPENAVLHYAFGLALKDQSVEERERAFKKALTLKQNFPEAQQALAELKR